MASYKVTDTELTSIANAIRTKGGTHSQLEFPTEFVSAIQAIPKGGGSTNILSGKLPPTSLDGNDGALYLLYGGISLAEFTEAHQMAMALVQKNNSKIEYNFTGGSNIGAIAYKLIDLTNANDLYFSISTGNRSYDNYNTPRFCPFICLKQSSSYCTDSDAETDIGAATILKTANSTKNGVIDVSSYTGNYYVCFNGSVCDCSLDLLGVDNSGEITNTYLKVNGSWQNLIGSDINDVYTGGISANLLDEYQVEWWDKSADGSTGVNQVIGIIGITSSGLSICTTKTPIDFTGKSKIKVSVSVSSGQYNTLSRIAVSENPITNSNRGDVYTQFLNGPGEYELVLPEQKTSLYVAIEIWTNSIGAVPLIIAE